jgi:hypothetical protein
MLHLQQALGMRVGHSWPGALVMAEHDPAVALWVAAGYARDRRVGRFVRSLRSGAGP